MNKAAITFQILLIFLCVTQCEKKHVLDVKRSGEYQEKSRQSIHSSNKVATCYDIIKDIVASSDLNIKVYNDNYKIIIDDIRDDSISIHVYTENNLSDNTNERQMVESTIAWLIFLPGSQKLLNTTSDPENPVELRFDKNIIRNNNIFKICEMSEKHNSLNSLKINAAEKRCKKISGEMISGEQCILKDVQIKTAYNNIIENGLVDDAHLLLKAMPAENTSIEINKNGLMMIDYQITQRRIDISMSYEGGITEIILEQIGKNVKRTIQYNAD